LLAFEELDVILGFEPPIPRRLQSLGRRLQPEPIPAVMEFSTSSRAGKRTTSVIPASEYESFQDEMKSRLEALPDDKGQPLKSLVFKPRELYKNVRNVAPDLVVHFGGLYWRSIGTVGHSAIHVQENDTGPDGCNHAQFGMFILAAPNCPLTGEYEGVRLLDIAPTLLDLAGYEIPDTMQGRSLVAGMEKKTPGGESGDREGEKTIHDRLAGLGYV
jgi:hypothetical protein